jgi:phosphotransferase system enzyme I (PtsI)
MSRDTWPDEDEQFEAYKSVVKTMAGKPVTVRTLDVGADKELEGATRTEDNPALGLRAIRFCLAEPKMFLTQLRALLRASHFGKMKILIPMLASSHEIDQTLVLLDKAKAQLRERKIKFDEAVPVGGMIEVPAAALCIGAFTRRLQFLSIGTNDLIQYTLAIDRGNEAVAHLYNPLHPAVLRLIHQTIQAGAKAGVPVSVCGEMAGDPECARLLIGMGLRQFSMHPAQILEVKQAILRADASDLTPKVLRLLKLDDPDRVREAVEKL